MEKCRNSRKRKDTSEKEKEKNLYHPYREHVRRERGIGEKIWMYLINLGQSWGKKSSRKVFARVVNSVDG